MGVQKYLLDDELETIQSQDIDDAFEVLMNEEDENNIKKFDLKSFKDIGKKVQDITEVIGQTAEKVGITAEALTDAVDKVGSVAKKIGAGSKEIGEGAIKKVKEIDIKKLKRN